MYARASSGSKPNSDTGKWRLISSSMLPRLSLSFIDLSIKAFTS